MTERTRRAEIPVPNRSLYRWVLFLSVLIGIGCLLFFYFLYRAQHAWDERYHLAKQEWETRLQHAIAEAEQLDGSWQLEELEGSQLAFGDPSEAIRIGEGVKNLLPEKWPNWVSPNHGPNPTLTREIFSGLSPPLLLKPSQFEEMKTEIKRAEAAIKLARKFIDEPSGRLAFSWSEDPRKSLAEYPQPGPSGNVLSYDALFRAQEGDVNGAMESCLAHLNHVSLIGNIPTPHAQEVRQRIRWGSIRELEHILALGEPSSPLLERFQRRLVRESEVPLDLMGERGYRAALDRLCQLMLEGEISAANYFEKKQTISQDVLEDGWHRQQLTILEGRTILLEMFNRRIEILKLPPERWFEEYSKVSQPFDQLPPFVRRLLSLPGGAGWQLNRPAKIRSAITGIALERFRQKHLKWPEQLTDLVPEYLPEVLIDPHDGKPLRYQRLGDGVVIYSIGRDREDGLGILNREGPLVNPDDVGFQLWDVQHRRRPQE